MLDSSVVAELQKIDLPRLSNVVTQPDEKFIGLPVLSDKALPGNVGHIINAIEPFTEADRAGLLMHFMSALGCLIGRTTYFKIGQSFHFLKLNTVIVGASGYGRKGTSWEEIKPLFERADESFANRIIGGLSTGEGLVNYIGDSQYKDVQKKELDGSETVEKVLVKQGATDKRLLVIETEFSSLLQRAKREMNTLSAIIRQAWDSGTLRVITKQPIEATNTHIAIVGHITKDELQKHLNDTETANGFANRFLWACVRRSKYLPDAVSVPENTINDIVTFLGHLKNHALATGEMFRDISANELWYEVYPRLSDGHTGLLGAVTSRATAYILRMACLYSLLDGKDYIGYDHLESALALWQFCEDSARYIFGVSNGDAIADKIELALKGIGEGLNQTQISKLFQGHEASERIKVALSTLLDNGRITSEEMRTEGRKKVIFRHADCEKSEKSEIN